ELDIFTAGGVFSPKKLDTGTKLLIEHAELHAGRKVLDLGCGYGVLGAVLKKLNPDLEIWMTDVNPRAVKLAKMNVKNLKVDAEVLQGDVFANKTLRGKEFDVIFLNPPQTAGKKLCFRMIEESKGHLVQGGCLQLVARHQKGGKELSKKMESVFGNVSEAAKGSGFRVYVSQKTS
ncbi:methyltransferase, partial [Candidatus Woesearchaeota archaeon]|nr:methyltransferase [Candidatus Woesearchaeota archaeon]